MPGPVNSVHALPWRLEPPSVAAQRPAASGQSFQDLLLQSIEQTGQMEQQAQLSVEQALTGDELTLVETFSSVKQADLSLRLMLQVRNKLMDAYNEIKQLRM